ncbi:GNAT family N-acetyltransferase [Microbulbifer elongatus]|uniref:GNAT family N-acetyltransferase n=1 Tax=Microbulbifer elongatus TaxID=86173 RepID=UPI001E34B71A|nr:GNAT family N-acetyltransferase [Microbulbifer elongatus]
MKTTLSPFQQSDMPELMAWIDSEQACRVWAGSWFQYPFNQQTFSRDCRWQDMPTYVLRDDDGLMLAFGQYYKRLDCCHLARLIVSPRNRRQGLGAQLVVKLVAEGSRQLGLTRASLFVLKSNAGAQELYQSLGFRTCEYPEPEPSLEICHYMVAPVHQNEDMSA